MRGVAMVLGVGFGWENGLGWVGLGWIEIDWYI